MTCRIDRVVNEDNTTVLCISGKISGEHVDTLRNVLRHEAGALIVDLGNVSLIDREGVQLLALTEDTGLELRNCPPYIREWVTREKVDMRADGQEQK
jgi:anti-anti-sigma regulatory factor